MNFDPYRILDVERDADLETIKRAYRKKAKKSHPDKGGNVDEFVRASKALAILNDPKKKAHFDATGEIEQEKPDNSLARALELIERFVAGAVEHFLSTGGNDARHRALLIECRLSLEGEILAQQSLIEKGKGVRKYTEDLGARFSGGPKERFLQKMFESRLRKIDAEFEKMEDAIAIRRKAIAILETYNFDTSIERDQVNPRME